MSEEKRYVTFKDLRSVATVPENTPDRTSTSTSSTPSTPIFKKLQQPPQISRASIRDSTVAPEKDFQRIPNSITRSAIPDGLFRGKSKQVWDYLWSITRGAIVPIRLTRKSRREIKVGSGLGSMVTVDAALEHLQSVGLLTINSSIGSLSGNEYEIFTPEEAYTRYTSTSSTSSTTSLTQKVDVLDVLDSSISSTTQLPLESTTSECSKTSLKTDDDDTHTLGKFTETFMEAIHCVVGGDLVNSEQERERWNELGKLLADELKDAAQRTNSISSVPAFFTAHLRRRLARKTASPAEVKTPSESPPKTYRSFASHPRQGIIKEPDKTSERGASATDDGGSKFSLEECRRYADHLHMSGQGITNPGGFALTIYRSGISDAFIEKFLHPSNEMPVDASACETCHGTGFYYPNGAEQGVAKCRHEGLKTGVRRRRRLKPEEIIEQANVIGELLESGYTMEQAELQFAAGLDVDDWAVIRTRIEGKNSL